MSFLPLLLILSPASLPTSTQAQLNLQTNFPARVAPDVLRVGILQQPALSESSGLAASPRYPGVYWTHNDTGGDPAFLFAINERGEHLGGFQVDGARLIDWEAITFDQAGNLYLADLGTNGLTRTHQAIHRAEEPDPSDRWGPANVEQTWFIRYPDARRDAESFFVHNGYGYIITKYESVELTPDGLQRSVRLYRFSLANSATSITLEFVAFIPINGNVSDASLSSDGNRLALITSDGVTVLFINGDPASVGTARRESTDYQNTNIEGATFAEGGILTTADANPEILLFTNPLLRGAPQFTTALTNIASFVGRTVTFVAEVIASPAATFEWSFNGLVIPGETNSTLTLADLSFGSAGNYEVTASNPAGVARSSAQLSVSEKVPDLRITELMSGPASGSASTRDWWELTSFDPETNDLSGWRFNDSTGGLVDAFVIPPGTQIRPGETIVFVEVLSPEQFRAWWGSNNIPAEVQVITFTGAALSFNAMRDSLRIWDNRATNDATVATSVGFGAAQTGISFILDPATGQFGANSQLGVLGAFQAVSGPDIGSPGLYLTNASPELRLQGKLQGSSVQLTFAPTVGESYLLEVCEDISLRNWTSTGDIFQSTNSAAIFVQKQQDGTRRFYRLRKQ